MNPSNFSCPSDIAQFVTTDFRPNKSLYVNVRNNNQFRKYLQDNAVSIMSLSKNNFYDNMHCGCEGRNNYYGIKPFNYEDKFQCQGMGKESATATNCKVTDVHPWPQPDALRVPAEDRVPLFKTSVPYAAPSDRHGSYSWN